MLGENMVPTGIPPPIARYDQGAREYNVGKTVWSEHMKPPSSVIARKPKRPNMSERTQNYG